MKATSLAPAYNYWKKHVTFQRSAGPQTVREVRQMDRRRTDGNGGAMALVRAESEEARVLTKRLQWEGLEQHSLEDTISRECFQWKLCTVVRRTGPRHHGAFRSKSVKMLFKKWVTKQSHECVKIVEGKKEADRTGGSSWWMGAELSQTISRIAFLYIKISMHAT